MISLQQEAPHRIYFAEPLLFYNLNLNLIVTLNIQKSGGIPTFKLVSSTRKNPWSHQPILEYVQVM